MNRVILKIIEHEAYFYLVVLVSLPEGGTVYIFGKTKQAAIASKQRNLDKIILPRWILQALTIELNNLI